MISTATFGAGGSGADSVRRLHQALQPLLHRSCTYRINTCIMLL